MADMSTPLKGVAFDLAFVLYKTDGTIVANPGTYTKKVWKDGGAAADIAGNVTEVDTTYGRCKVQLSTSEMNADVVDVYIKDDTAGCIPFTATVYPAAYNAGAEAALVHAHAATIESDVAAVHTHAQTIIDNVATLDTVVDNIHDTDLPAVASDVAAVHVHVGTIDGHVTADYTATEKAAIDLLDDANGLVNIHDTLDTVAGYVDTEVAAILAAVDTEVAAILADTNELQTDLVNGGRLDLILDAIQACTDRLTATRAGYVDKLANLPAAPAATGDAMTLTAAYDKAKDDVLTPLAVVDGNVDAILVDTGTTLDAAIAALPTDADVQVAAAAALTAYDPPTRAEATSDKEAVIAALPAAAPAASAVADAVWDEAVAGHAGAGSTGATLAAASAPSAATVADAVWNEATADHSTAGSTGKALTDAGAAGTPLDAAGVRAAVGMASANLDTQIAGLPTDADVNAACDTALTDYDAPTKAELDAAFTEVKGATWAATDTLEAIHDDIATTDGHVSDTFDDVGTMQTSVDAILADTNELQTNQGGWATATGFAEAGDAMTLTSGERSSIATAVWAATARTLSSMGSLAADVWAVATRSLTDKAGFTLHADYDAAKTAAPTAAANADAVWDEAVAGHATSGSAGAALAAAGIAGDPWSADVPGSYGAGTAGALLPDLAGALSSLGAASVTVTSPVAASGAVTIYAGDDYDADHGREISFAVADSAHALGLDDVGAAVSLKCSEATWAGTATSTTAGYTVTFEPTHAQTAALDISRQAYELEATLADGDVVTLATGTLAVIEDIPAA